MEEDLDELLSDKRVSVDLTPENARFYRSAGDLISLDLIGKNGEKEYFERIVPVRAFPITEPDEYISIREPDTRERGKGQEIGLIRKLSDFNSETVKLINEELDRRYFTPVIKKIVSLKEKFGYYYFDALTSAGKISFVMNNPYSNFRTLEDGRVFMYDIDGNCFEIPDPYKLDKQSLKLIEIFL